jgi:methanogenic corrinoid protein MtbC1
MGVSIPLDDAADPWRSARLAAFAAASAGDAGAVYHLVAELMSDGVPFPAILFELLSPLEAEVGTRWQRGDFHVAEEHTVTATLETIVSLLAGSFDIPEDACQVMVACAEGHNHSLPPRMVAAHLVFLGWQAVFLGPGQPATELGAFLREQPPEALILSCAMATAMATALPGARACIREAHEAGLPVLAGGQGFGPDGRRAEALGADAWTAGARRVDEILRSWEPDPAEAESRLRDSGEALPRLGECRVELLARAAAALATPDTSGEPARIVSDLELLLDALAASLLLDDPEVVVQMAAWQRSSPEAATDVAAALAALREALPAGLLRAAAFLDPALG